MGQEFYHHRNYFGLLINGRLSSLYECINVSLSDIGANIRFGPPLNKKGEYFLYGGDLPGLWVGIYGQDKKVSKNKVSLEKALREFKESVVG